MRLDSLNALPGLLPGLFRGHTLHFVDASSEHGRRVVEYLFPGVDAAAYDDFGLLPQSVWVDALVIGDDYKSQVKALQRAFETPGPGQLIHPWLGPMMVMMDEPAGISFSSREMRVARISARFKRVLPQAVITGLLSSLDESVASLISAARAMISVVSSGISIMHSAAVRRSARVLISAAASVEPEPDGNTLVPRIRAALASAVPETPAVYSSWLTEAAAGLTSVVEPSAVGAHQTAVSPPSARTKAAVAILLSSTLTDAARSAPSDADAALLLGAAGELLAGAARQTAYADFSSRPDATGYRTRLVDALASLIEQTETIEAETYQSAVSELIRSARRVSAAIVIEIHEVVGRLPGVLSFSAGRPQDAWQVAQHVAGDRPSQIEDVYLDIVLRNRPNHPAMLEAGRVEVLEIG
jgi:prophage DNA circulation protein